MFDRILQITMALSVAALAVTCTITLVDRFVSKPDAYPVACADIPESNQRVVIIRDGQVECHYSITVVRAKPSAGSSRSP